MKKLSESDVVRACLNYLTVRGIFAWRQNTGGAAFQHKDKTYHVRFGFPGMSDILGVLPGGTILACECKKPGARTSKKRALQQAAFREQVTKSGGLALVAHTVDDLHDAIISWIEEHRHAQ
jgi:hypothetical protein